MIKDKLIEIVEADKKARNKITTVSQSSERIEVRLREDRALFEEKYKKAAEEIIEKSAKKHEKILTETALDYKKRLQETADNIEKLVDKKKNEWVCSIVGGVTRA